MQKYNILELNEKLLPELQSIAEELGIKKVSSLKKEELVYRILDEQAISYAGIQAEKEKEKEAKKAERQTKAKKTKAAAPKGAKADAKTKVAAPATPVEASVEEVVPEAPEQPERKRRTRIDGCCSCPEKRRSSRFQKSGFSQCSCIRNSCPGS